MKKMNMILAAVLMLGVLFYLGPPLALGAEGKVLRIALDAADISDLHPHYSHTTQDRGVVHLIFNGLVRYRTGDISKFEPDLAESWEVMS